MLDTIKDDGGAIGLRLDGQEFLAEDDTGHVIVPKSLLKGFRLSDIPDELLIKPVNSIEGNVIEVEHDILIAPFRDGIATAEVEDMGRRKLWDGDVGFPKFMNAMRQAIRERNHSLGDVAEKVFDDDGDYIVIRYEVTLPEDVDIEEAVAHVESVVGDLEERRDQILARRLDPLLSIFDKGSFDIDLAHVLQTARATGRSVGLLFVDIDHFKRINDSLGHQAGNVVLREVARVLADTVRGRGEAYRWGGEELAVLLPDADAQGVASVAEEIRRAFEQRQFEGGMRVTVSCGAASFPEHAATPQELVTTADAAVYRAKAAGRNAVKVARNEGDGHGSEPDAA